MNGFKKWFFEGIAIAYGAGFDPVGMDTQDDKAYVNIKSKYHTFEGDKDKDDDQNQAQRLFGFKRGDPLLAMQNQKNQKKQKK